MNDYYVHSWRDDGPPRHKGECKVCTGRRTAAYRRADPRRAREGQRLWRERNREHRNATERQRYAADPSKAMERTYVEHEQTVVPPVRLRCR